MKVERTSRRPPPLDPHTLHRLRALIVRVGEYRAVELLDMPRITVNRAAAGVGIRRATADIVRMRLDAIDEGKAA